MKEPKIRFKADDGSDFPESRKCLIGDIYWFKNGLNKEKSAFGIGTPIVNYKDVFNNRIIRKNCLNGKVTLNPKEIENYSAQEGDVFFTRTSETLDEIGISAAMVEDIEKCVFSGFLLRARPYTNDMIVPEYAGYYFFTDNVRKQIIARSSITTRALTSGPKLSEVEIIIPCLEEQKKIASFFSDLDDVISASEAEVEALEKQKKGAMQKIFSQEVRFMRDDGRAYPDWTMYYMRDVTEEYKERNKKRLPLEIYSVNNEVGFLPQSEQFDEAGYLQNTDTSIYMIVPPNYFAYNPARINVGSIGYQNTGKTVQVSSLYEVFKTADNVNDSFLWNWFHTDYFNFMVKRFQEGGVRQYYYYDKLAISKILLPCLEEQQKIADFLSDFDTAINLAKQELEKWKLLKKGLMQQMFV